MKRILLILILFPLFLHSQIKVKDLPTKTSNYKQGDNIIIDDSVGTSGSTKKISIRNLKTNYGFGAGSGGGGGDSINGTANHYSLFDRAHHIINAFLYQSGTAVILPNANSISSPNGHSSIILANGSIPAFDLEGSDVNISQCYGDSSSCFLNYENATSGHNGNATITGTQLNLKHDQKLKFDAPVYNFSQATSAIPVINSSKNLDTLKVGSGLSYNHTTNTLSATGSGGTVTNVSTGYGLTGGPITTTGTIVADTSTGKLATQYYGARNYIPLSGTTAGKDFTGTINVTGTLTNEPLYGSNAYYISSANDIIVNNPTSMTHIYLNSGDNLDLETNTASTGAQCYFKMRGGISNGTGNLLFKRNSDGKQVAVSFTALGTSSISSNNASYAGWTYGADYSANYTSRSLIDKGYASATFAPIGINGTVTSFTVTTANGVSATVANSTTTPNATFTLGAITPTSTNGVSATTMAYNDATSSIQTQLNAKQATITATPPLYISSNVVSSHKASVTDSGYVSTSTQTFAGNKTFAGTIKDSSETIQGTYGNGFLELKTQATNPSYPSSGTRLFSNSNSKFSWRGSANTYVKTFDGAAATADRVYSLPDKTMTVADAADVTTLAQKYSTLLVANYTPAGVVAANTFYMVSSSNISTNLGSTFVTTSGTATVVTPALIYIAAADYPTVNGVAPKLRIRAGVFTNHTAPTGNFTFGLYPMTCPASSGGTAQKSWTIGTVVTGSDGATQSTPAADTHYSLVSSDFALPSDGWYAICVVTTAQQAANSYTECQATLQIHNQ